MKDRHLSFFKNLFTNIKKIESPMDTETPTMSLVHHAPEALTNVL